MGWLLESDAKAHRTPKALGAKRTQIVFHCAQLGVRARPRATLGLSVAERAPRLTR
jgi:hypothetical protein